MIASQNLCKVSRLQPLRQALKMLPVGLECLPSARLRSTYLRQQTQPQNKPRIPSKQLLLFCSVPRRGSSDHSLRPSRFPIMPHIGTNAIRQSHITAVSSPPLTIPEPGVTQKQPRYSDSDREIMSFYAPYMRGLSVPDTISTQYCTL